MITLTDNARQEIRRRLAREGGPAVVRLDTRSGGCAGTKYVVEVGRAARPDDVVVAEGDLTVVCGRAALPALRGLVVDWVDALMGGGWRFANPNAGGTCGCGESFRPLIALDSR